MDNFTASDLRRFAMRCTAAARDTADAAERVRLEKMSAALLQLAENEDWLNGNARANPALQDDPDIQKLLAQLGNDEKGLP